MFRSPKNVDVAEGAIANQPPNVNQRSAKEIRYNGTLVPPIAVTAATRIITKASIVIMCGANLSHRYPKTGLPIPLKRAKTPVAVAAAVGVRPQMSQPYLADREIAMNPPAVPKTYVNHKPAKVRSDHLTSSRLGLRDHLSCRI